jgi:hypothetical protein
MDFLHRFRAASPWQFEIVLELRSTVEDHLTRADNGTRRFGKKNRRLSLITLILIGEEALLDSVKQTKTAMILKPQNYRAQSEPGCTPRNPARLRRWLPLKVTK